MPELPEVETIRRGLEKHVVGKTIVSVDVHLPKILNGDITQVIGATITKVERFGKGLILEFDNDYAMAVHVKMTGQLVIRGLRSKNQELRIEKKIDLSNKVGGDLPHKHTHVIFKLKVGDRHSGEEPATTPESRFLDKSQDRLWASQDALGIPTSRGQDDEVFAMLYYNDIRQFGWIKIDEKVKIKNEKFFRELGPDALKELRLERFKEITTNSKSPIKSLLMDQTKIAGIGNIYANDALWEAKIHPLRKANSLTTEEIERLFGAIETVLQKSISLGGASETNYVNALGQEGTYQEHFLVYNQSDKPCKRCGTKIERIKVGGRGTFVCPACQYL